MALIRFAPQTGFRNPWAEFERIRQELDAFSRTLAGETARPRATVYPPLNIAEDADNLVIKAELPGVRAEDLDISIEGETLTLQGKRAPRHDEENVSYHRREIETGSFSRAITLPTRVDVDKINARLVNGILTITLQKAAEVKPRQISVTTD